MAPIKQSTSENDRRKAFIIETHRLGKSRDRRSALPAYAADIEVGRKRFTRSKINRSAHVEAELWISMGEAGEDWETISIVKRWVVIKEKFGSPPCGGESIWNVGNIDWVESKRGQTPKTKVEDKNDRNGRRRSASNKCFG